MGKEEKGWGEGREKYMKKDIFSERMKLFEDKKIVRR